LFQIDAIILAKCNYCHRFTASSYCSSPSSSPLIQSRWIQILIEINNISWPLMTSYTVEIVRRNVSSPSSETTLKTEANISVELLALYKLQGITIKETLLSENIFFFRFEFLWPPLWPSGQTYWLLTQRSRVRFSAIPDFLSSSGSGTGTTHPLWR
jgi:hypothetical protein